MKSAKNCIALVLATLAMPVIAQTFAPAPRALAPATAVHPCMAPPQGQGPTSTECKRECERNPQATQCPRSPVAAAPAAAPNWGAAVAPAPGGNGAAPGTSKQMADGSVRPAAAAPPMAMAGAPASALSGSSTGAPSAPMPMAPRPSPSSQQRTPAALAPAQATPVTTPAASASPVQQGGSGVATAAARGDAVLKPVEATPVTTPAVSANPVQPASQAAWRAAAIATIPGAAESPRIQADSFVVDFGKAYSGDQVRRTVVLNMTAAGEAEFILNAQAAPGFGIAEVRAMGAGASSPPPTGATSLSQRNNTMAVRQVAQRVSAPPWKLRVSEPTELQVDVVYAPKFDAFNNMAGPKSVQLDARVRNVRGEGMGVPFELRAQFQGLQLGVSVVVKTPTVYQRDPANFFPSQPQALEPGAVTLSVANLSGAPLTLKIDAQELPAKGLAAKPVDIYLGKDETRLVDVPLTYVPDGGWLSDAQDAGKPASLRLSASNGWKGSAGFRVVQVVDRSWEASGPNWWVGVHLGRDGSYHIYSRCHLNFPQTEYNCRFVIDLGNGVARRLLLAPRINANPRCAYQPGSVNSATAENVAAAMATPKVILMSVDGKVDPGPNTFHEKRVLQQVPYLVYGEDCVSQFSRDHVPRY